MEGFTQKKDLSDHIDTELLGGARVIHQDLNDSIETATAILPVEPPESGDFHEALALRDGTGDVAVLLGDVTGHGAAAAEKADKIRRTAIASLKSGCSPLETVEAANDSSESDGDDRYATLFVAKIDSETGEVSYANAGHEPPVIIGSSGTQEMLSTTGPPLGVVPTESTAFAEEVSKLDPGGTLVLTTDGVVEARAEVGTRREFFGSERLSAVLATVYNSHPVKIVTAIVARILDFSRKVLHDDVVVMAIRRRSGRSRRRAAT